MTNWKAEINIKRDLERFNDNNMGEVGLAVISKLKGSGYFPSALIHPLYNAVRHEDVDAFDRALGFVYDFADQEKIWLGA